MKKPLLMLLVIGCILTSNAQNYKLVHYKNINKAAQPAFNDIYLYKNGTFEYWLHNEEQIMEVAITTDEFSIETKPKTNEEILNNVILPKGTWVMTGNSIVLKLENGKKKTLTKVMLDQNMMRLQDKEAVYYLVKE